jgi:glycosyltransferase involved in cell wall biosynthesis
MTQTWSNLEIIIVDDGSTDNTKEIIQKTVGKYLGKSGYPPVMFIPLEHDGRGIGRSLNIGVAKMHGDWFREFQSDDVMLPDGVEKIMKHIYEEQANWEDTIYYADVELINDVGGYVGFFPAPNYNEKDSLYQNAWLLQYNYGNGTTVTIHKSAFQKHDLFPEDTWHEDYLHRMQWCMVQGAQMHYIPEKVAKYRVHPASFTQNNMTWKEHQREDWRIKKLIMDQLTPEQKDKLAELIIKERIEPNQFPDLFKPEGRSLERVIGLLLELAPERID